MKKYTPSELLALFREAIYDMSKRGLLGPAEVKDYLNNIQSMLNETVGN